LSEPSFVTDTPTTAPRPGRRVGRPARVDRDQIAQAAAELGLSGLTMRAVAERLGVSTTSLYYHVRDRDELRNLVAERTTASHRLPVPAGQHWTRWLAEWADYSRAAFVSEPGLLEHYLNGTLRLGLILANLDVVVAHLERQGFATAEAVDAYALVSWCALGAAVSQIRSDHVVGSGRLSESELKEAGRRSRRARQLAALQSRTTASFEQQLVTVLVGIAERRGQPVGPALRAFDPAVSR
jgi:AcrR family transcriptional regulator